MESWLFYRGGLQDRFDCNSVFNGFFKLFCFHTVLIGVYSTPLLFVTMLFCSFIFL